MRREAVDAEREIVWLSEKKRRVDSERLTGAALGTAGDRGGDMGPRKSFSRWTAVSQRVQGWWCDSPMWPQPLLDFSSVWLGLWFFGWACRVAYYNVVSCGST